MQHITRFEWLFCENKTQCLCSHVRCASGRHSWLSSRWWVTPRGDNKVLNKLVITVRKWCYFLLSSVVICCLSQEEKSQLLRRISSGFLQKLLWEVKSEIHSSSSSKISSVCGDGFADRKLHSKKTATKAVPTLIAISAVEITTQQYLWPCWNVL